MKREPFWSIISFDNKKKFDTAVDKVERIAQSIAFFNDGHGPIKLYAMESSKLIYIYTMHGPFLGKLHKYEVERCYSIPKLGKLEPYWELPCKEV